MIDIIVDDIIEYITREVMPERWNLACLVKGFKMYIKDDYDKQEIPKYIEFIKQLKEIRHIYQTGKVFVDNQTKGSKKGYLMRWNTIMKQTIERTGITDEVIENVKNHLNFIKEYKSERTYYRHLKKVRELGIDIRGTTEEAK